MSALEQEPVFSNAVAIAAAETVLQALSVPGVQANYSLSNPQSINNPNLVSTGFKFIRVRGIAWVTSGGTATFITIRLRQGVGTGGVQVNAVSFTNTVSATAAAGVTQVPVPFEFWDTAPAGVNYTLTAQGGAGTTVSAVTNVTGFDG